MSNINDLKAQKYVETESKRYESEIKQMKTENERTYSTESKQKELELKKMRSDYETRISNLKSEQEIRLGEIRTKQSRTINEESARLKQEIENLKKIKFDLFADFRRPSQNLKISFHETFLKLI